jgi:hypothetical protein
VLPIEPQNLECVLHVALPDSEDEPTAGDEVCYRRVLSHPQGMVHRQEQHVRPDRHALRARRYGTRDDYGA